MVRYIISTDWKFATMKVNPLGYLIFCPFVGGPIALVQGTKIMPFLWILPLIIRHRQLSSDVNS